MIHRQQLPLDVSGGELGIFSIMVTISRWCMKKMKKKKVFCFFHGTEFWLHKCWECQKFYSDLKKKKCKEQERSLLGKEMGRKEGGWDMGENISPDPISSLHLYGFCTLWVCDSIFIFFFSTYQF